MAICLESKYGFIWYIYVGDTYFFFPMDAYVAKNAEVDV